MRSSLRWLLLGTVCLTIVAVWWPVDGSGIKVVAARASDATSGQLEVPAVTISVPSSRERVVLPARLPVHSLDKSDFDPFVGLQPTPAAAPPLAPPPKPFVGPIYVPPPPPPSIQYRYLGQMIDPTGKQVVYLARPDKEVPVSVGTHLDEGYVVEAITAEGVRLHYPALDARTVVPIPHSDGNAPFASLATTR
jgi:hypothetical protein